MITLDYVVIVSLLASVIAPVIFLSLGWMKTTQLRNYVKSLRAAYVWFTVYGLIRWLML